MHWVKNHGKVLAVCDEKILGKEFCEGERVFKVGEFFYKGELVSTPVLKDWLKCSANINIVGEDSIKAARSLKMLAATDKIQNVPYAIIIKV